MEVPVSHQWFSLPPSLHLSLKSILKCPWVSINTNKPKTRLTVENQEIHHFSASCAPERDPQKNQSPEKGP